jgi:hypothetical protein
MNATRLLVAILVAFVVVFATDFVIHSIWLMPDYNATKSLWRPESEMTSHFPFMLAAQLLFAAMLCLIWALGFAGRSLGTAIVFGLFMGLFQQVWPIATYVVMPLPGTIAVKWIISGVLQVILVTIVAALVYRPRASAA